MRMKVLLALALVCASLAVGQIKVSLETILIWRAAGDTVKALYGLGAYMGQKERIRQDLEVARDKYWKIPPNGPGFEEARQAYSVALFAKDQFNAQNEAVASTMANAEINGQISGQLAERMRGGFGAIENVTGGVLERPLPIAQLEFSAWVKAMLQNRRSGQSVEQAFRSSLPQYETYARMRDRGEYLFVNPQSPLLSKDPLELTAAVYMGCKLVSPELALQRAVEIDRVINDRKVLLEAASDTSKYIRESAPRIRDYSMTVFNLTESSCASVFRLNYGLVSRSPRAYAISLISSNANTGWTEAAAVLSDWEKRLGEAKVRAAAQRVQTASAQPNGIIDKSVCSSSVPLVCLTEILGVTPPPSQAGTALEKEFAAVRAGLDRPAMKAMLLDQMRSAGAGDKAESQYDQLATWLDETFLLASAQGAAKAARGAQPYPFPAVVRKMSNFSLVDGQELAFVQQLILFDYVISVKKGTLPQSAAELAGIHDEFQALLGDHGKTKLIAAASAYKRNFGPTDAGFRQVGARPNETGYTGLLRELGDARRLAPRENAASEATRQDQAKLASMKQAQERSAIFQQLLNEARERDKLTRASYGRDQDVVTAIWGNWQTYEMNHKIDDLRQAINARDTYIQRSGGSTLTPSLKAKLTFLDAALAAADGK